MKIKKLVIFFLLLAMGSVAISSGTDLLPNTVKYRLDLTIDYSSGKLSGKCEIILLNHTNQKIQKIPVLLYRLLSINSISDDRGRPIEFTQRIVNIKNWEKIQVNYVEIMPSRDFSPGNKLVLNIDYSGYLLGYSNEGWRYVKDHIDKNFTIIRTDGFGYPVIGYPDAENMMCIVREKYDYNIDITLPSDVVPVSGGILAGRTENGKNTTWYFKSIKPSWRLDIAAGDYRTISKNKVSICYFKNDSMGAENILNDFEKAVSLYSSWFGDLKDFKGFTIIEVPEGYGSQADVAAILLTADSFNKNHDPSTLYHEASHLWNAGNTESQPSRFESEGLARFLENLLVEELDNKQDQIAETSQKYLEQVRKDFSKNPDFQNIPIKDYGIRNMTYYSYTLGMVAFAVLYEKTGCDDFRKMVRTYYSEYHEKGGSLNDFVDCCKKVSSIDLDRYFNDWIYTTRAIKKIMDGMSFRELAEYYRNN